jgi:hypothetical protein
MSMFEREGNISIISLMVLESDSAQLNFFIGKVDFGDEENKANFEEFEFYT